MSEMGPWKPGLRLRYSAAFFLMLLPTASRMRCHKPASTCRQAGIATHHQSTNPPASQPPDSHREGLFVCLFVPACAPYLSEGGVHVEQHVHDGVVGELPEERHGRQRHALDATGQVALVPPESSMPHNPPR